MKNIIIIVLFTCLYFPHSIAQSHTSWLNYSFSQRVTGIDIIGNYIWISTQGGLVKYNKKTGEKTFYNRANSNLPDNNLLGLFCNTNGDVWVGGRYYGVGKLSSNKCSIYNQTNSGLPFDQLNTQIKVDKKGDVWVVSFRWMAKYDGNNWKTWTTGSDFSAMPLVSGFDIDKNGVVWLYSTDGIGKIENDEYSIVSTIGSGLIAKFGCVEIDNDQNVWVAIEDIGIYKYNGSTFTLYSTSNSCLPTNSIFAISFDSDNNMWLATTEGLVEFNNSVCNLYSPGISDKALLSVKADNNDTIWCGTISGKLLCFDGSDFTSIDLSNSPLHDNYITDILIDDENTKWFGTKKNLVKKTDNQFYSMFNKSVKALAKGKTEEIWIAFGSGDTCLLKFESDITVIFDSVNSPFNTSKIIINGMAVDNNNHLWIASRSNGLYKYDGITFTNYNTSNSAIPSNELMQLVFDKENNLWGGSANGLFKFDGSTWTVWNRTNSTIPTNVVVGLAFDSENKLWFACMDEERHIGLDFGGGLTCFDGQTMTTYNTSNSGLLTNTIFDVYVDKNDIIWLATWGGGLMSFNKTDKWASYNVTNSGIADNRVQKIKQDKLGKLWLGHIDAGISVFNPDSFILSVNNKDECNSSIVLFPNPVKDDLYLKIKTTDEKKIQASIYDLNGRLIRNLPIQIISQDNSIIHFKLQNLLQDNQIYILNIMCEGEQFNAKFLFDK